MKNIIIILIFVGFCHIGFAQEEPRKQKALKVLELSGAFNQIKNVKVQLLKLVPKEKHNEFTTAFENSLPGIYNKYATIYSKLYTEEDINAMIAFYESPVGKKIYQNSNEMALRSEAAAKEWMMGLQEIISAYSMP